MQILVTYDVATDDREGRRRLRRVARLCEDYGQRVQKSVFECTVNRMQVEALLHRIKHEIDPDRDSVRLYRLREPSSRFVEVIGKPLEYDLLAPVDRVAREPWVTR